MGFSAGAELAVPAAVLYDDWDKKNNDPADPFAGISSRPDFAALGFLQKPGVATKAAKDVATYVANPPRPFGQGPGGAGRQGRRPE